MPEREQSFIHKAIVSGMGNIGGRALYFKDRLDQSLTMAGLNLFSATVKDIQKKYPGTKKAKNVLSKTELEMLKFASGKKPDNLFLIGITPSGENRYAYLFEHDKHVEVFTGEAALSNSEGAHVQFPQSKESDNQKGWLSRLLKR